MRYRVVTGFVLGPGRIARTGDVLEIEEKVVRMGGINFTTQHAIHPSLIEPIGPEPVAPSTSLADGNSVRDAEPINRDPEPQNRDPRPRRQRARTGDQ